MQNEILNSSDLSHNFADGLFLKSEGQTDQDLVVFSHLRWDFVFQRPQHLLSRFATKRRVFFIEEPVFSNVSTSSYEKFARENDLQVIVPRLPENLSQGEVFEELKLIVDQVLEDEEVSEFTAWYYTPMALPFTRHLSPSTIIFDCMDELSAFKNAPPLLLEMEAELLRIADVVFTGGQSLYEAKKDRHHNVHAFPSSIDGEHFRQARRNPAEPADQKHIPHPRIGFFGVIDERMDIELVERMAKLRPDWHIVMIGPVVKIDPASLPQLPNIHYLGKKDYKELPQYLAGWDLAMLPFARNESTKFISPTKTPEYLAAGRPVVSTSIRDVIRPYAQEGLVSIADTAEEFVSAAEKAMEQAKNDPTWIRRVDEFLASMSWDMTFERMAALERKIQARSFRSTAFEAVAEAQLGT